MRRVFHGWFGSGSGRFPHEGWDKCGGRFEIFRIFLGDLRQLCGWICGFSYRRGRGLPEKGTSLPEKGTSLPKKGTSVPKKGTRLPKEGTDAPSHGNTAERTQCTGRAGFTGTLGRGSGPEASAAANPATRAANRHKAHKILCRARHPQNRVPTRPVRSFSRHISRTTKHAITRYNAKFPKTIFQKSMPTEIQFFLIILVFYKSPDRDFVSRATSVELELKRGG